MLQITLPLLLPAGLRYGILLVAYHVYTGPAGIVVLRGGNAFVF